MRRRLYFLLPDLDSAQRAMNDLLLARVEEKHIHFLAKDGTDLADLHPANLLQSSDIVHGAESGLIIGGAAGLAAGLVAAFYPLVGDGPQWGLMLVTFLIGAPFGAWVASMIGSSVPNSRLKPFQKAIDEGQILLMADIPKDRLEEVEGMLRNRHPEGHDEGVEPTIPAFP